MKLLNPKQIKERIDKSEQLKQKKILDINEELSKKTRELNTFKETFETEKGKVKAEYEAIRKELTQKKVQLLNEVTSLEARKIEALKPIKEQIQQLEQEKAQLEKRESDISDKEEKLAIDKSNVIAMSEQVSKQESDLEERKEVIEVKKKNIQKQQTQLSIDQSKFQKNQSDWITRIENREKQLEERELVVSLEQQANEVTKNSLAKERQLINLDRSRLEDQQQTLRRAFDEARSKNLL